VSLAAAAELSKLCRARSLASCSDTSIGLLVGFWTWQKALLRCCDDRQASCRLMGMILQDRCD
jgi:hypothetical protein